MKKDFNVKGMHCKSCGMLIKDSVGEIPGVNEVLVSHALGKVMVDCDDSVDEGLIKEAIRKEGFEVR
ncbi:TPA: heavy-metal-associated domain-containing protein [Candidatus Woesearchaeota archaeon]|nr:heavy-metal-associated domain-containing protein [Candidatus Woesearchaeota archaeon]